MNSDQPERPTIAAWARFRFALVGALFVNVGGGQPQTSLPEGGRCLRSVGCAHDARISWLWPTGSKPMPR
jgi:hypothetical protein